MRSILIILGLIILFGGLLGGCATISELPQSSKEVKFDSLDAGKTGMWKYEDSVFFKGVDKRTAFLAAKDGLANSDFILKKTNYKDGSLFGYHGITAHDWNVVAGIYLKEEKKGTAVKVVVNTSKDFSLIGNIGDTTSGSWPQLIISNMVKYIKRESQIDNPAKGHFK